MTPLQIEEPKISKIFFSSTTFSWLWLILRIYVGYQWLIAGWEKLQNPIWIGSKAGLALHGFLMGSLSKTTGQHPDVAAWYAFLIKNFFIHYATQLSYIVTWGEILVGVGLIIGAFTGIAAFFGSFMNMNYLFAGTLSINPLLFLIELFLILAWRVAGWYGVDHFLLPLLGTPWKSGKMFKKKK